MEDFFDDVADLRRRGSSPRPRTTRSAAPARCSRTADDADGDRAAASGWSSGRSRTRPQPDAKARELITYLKAVCRPDGEHWTNERVVVFTEYRDTQIWLADAPAPGGPRPATALALLHGGMDADEREQLRLAFQADPTEHPVRILLATDAASEGIDLQNHCHRLVNYDIPFNPNKLEQRIGRIDRYGQTHDPDIRHFVGTGWEHAVDSYEADLEFLSRVAKKVARMEEDLGSVNAVLADAVQRRMLGETVDVDVDSAAKATAAAPRPCRVRDRRARAGRAGCGGPRRDRRRARHHPGGGQAGRRHRARAGPPAAARPHVDDRHLTTASSTSRR